MISELALIDVVFDPQVKDAPVSDYMNPEVHLVHPDDPLSRAAQLFALYSFRRLPVVENGKLVGIVTRRDLMNFALRHEHVAGRSADRADSRAGTNELKLSGDLALPANRPNKHASMGLGRMYVHHGHSDRLECESHLRLRPDADRGAALDRHGCRRYLRAI